MALKEVEFKQIIQLTEKDDPHSFKKVVCNLKGIKYLTETDYGVQVNGSWIYPWHMIARVLPMPQTRVKKGPRAAKKQKSGEKA
jgi:hypothetical protein